MFCTIRGARRSHLWDLEEAWKNVSAVVPSVFRYPLFQTSSQMNNQRWQIGPFAAERSRGTNRQTKEQMTHWAWDMSQCVICSHLPVHHLAIFSVPRDRSAAKGQYRPFYSCCLVAWPLRWLFVLIENSLIMLMLLKCNLWIESIRPNRRTVVQFTKNWSVYAGA